MPSPDPLVILPGPGKPLVPLSFIHSPTSSSGTPTPTLPKMQFVPSHCIHDRCPLEGCPHTSAWLDGPLALPLEMQHPAIADFCLPLPLPSSPFPGLHALLPSGRPGWSFGYCRPGLEVTEDTSHREMEIEEILVRLGREKDNWPDEVDGEVEESDLPPASQQTVCNEPTLTCDIPLDERRRHMYWRQRQDVLEPTVDSQEARSSISIDSWIQSSSQAPHDKTTSLPITKPFKNVVIKKTATKIKSSFRVQNDVAPSSHASALDSTGNPLPPELVASLEAAKVVVCTATPITPRSPPTPPTPARPRQPGHKDKSSTERMATDTALGIVLKANLLLGTTPSASSSYPAVTDPDKNDAAKHSVKSGGDVGAAGARAASSGVELASPPNTPTVAAESPANSRKSSRAVVKAISNKAKARTVLTKPTSIPFTDPPATSRQTPSSKRASVASGGRSAGTSHSRSPLDEEALASHYNGMISSAAFDGPATEEPSSVPAPALLVYAPVRSETTNPDFKRPRDSTTVPSLRRTRITSEISSSQGSDKKTIPSSDTSLENSTGSADSSSNTSTETIDAATFKPKIQNHDHVSEQHDLTHPHLHPVGADNLEIWNETADRVFNEQSSESFERVQQTPAQGPAVPFRASSARVSIEQLVSDERTTLGWADVTRDIVEQDDDEALPRDQVRYMSEEERRNERAMTALKPGKYEEMLDSVDDKGIVLQLLEMEAEAKANGKAVEFTLDPAILQGADNQSFNEQPSSAGNGKKRGRAKVDEDDEKDFDMSLADDLGDTPHSSLLPRRLATYSKKTKPNSLDPRSIRLEKAPVEGSSATKIKNKGKVSKSESPLTEQSDGSVSAGKTQSGGQGPTQVTKSDRAKVSGSSFVAPKRTTATGHSANPVPDRKSVSAVRVRDEIPPAKKARLDNHSPAHNALWRSVQAKVGRQHLAIKSEGSRGGNQGDIYTDRDAEGSPDPDESSLETPTKSPDSFVAGPWERTRAASRLPTQDPGRDTRESTEEVEENAKRTVHVRAAQAVGRAKTAKALQVPFPIPGIEPEVRTKPAPRLSTEHVKFYTQEEDDLIRKTVAQRGGNLSKETLNECIAALEEAGMTKRTVGALGWRLRNILTSGV